jgi:hypothetical protein
VNHADSRLPQDIQNETQSCVVDGDAELVTTGEHQFDSLGLGLANWFAFQQGEPHGHVLFSQPSPPE